MKKFSRFLSVALALVLILSAFALPVSAASDVKVSYRAEFVKVVGEKDSEGNKSEDFGVYKLKVYTTANVLTPGVVFNIFYDENVVVPIDANMGDIVYEYLCDDDYPTVAYNLLGSLGDTHSYDKNGAFVASRPAYFGGSHANAKKNVKLERAEAGKLIWNYTSGDKTAVPGLIMDEGIFEAYFALQPGKTEADLQGKVFSFGDNAGHGVMSVAYDPTPSANRFYTSMGSGAIAIKPADIPAPDFVFASSAVGSANQQIRITVDGNKATTDTFDYRFVSSISAADWAAKFANTAKPGATTNCITEAGFAFKAGTDVYTMADAKADIASGAANVYTTQTIRPGATYDFGCVVTNIEKAFATNVVAGELTGELQIVSYVKYLDAAGNPQIEYAPSVVTSRIHPGYINTCFAQGFTY